MTSTKMVSNFIPPGRIYKRKWSKKLRDEIKKNQIIVGIDGEGKTLGKGTKYEQHIYTLVCVSNETGEHAEYVENPNGLSTDEIFEFLLSLPDEFMFFAYGFSYDLTKILEGLDNESLYRLIRPETRKTNQGIVHQKWKDYKLDLKVNNFTLKRDTKRIVINDIVKFYQAKFVNALQEWKAAPQDVIDRISRMKDKRNVFVDESDKDIRNYCFEECRYMAVLARKLIQAHDDAGIPLTKFYGAGSSAESMLTVMGIKDVIEQINSKPITQLGLLDAVMRAYFGGRFENSIIGPVHETVHSWDISSAYPYQIYKLPCLIHGKWRYTKNINDINTAKSAVIKYVLHKPKKKKLWGPFPFRLSDGTILCPEYSGGGWVWKDEFLQANRVFDNIEFKAAYVYHTDCDCHPFEKIAEYYAERCRIGKEGPGIVLKLGCNSVYGKLAQSIGGGGKFTNWIYAGMITSGCRAQLLEMMALHSDIDNVLMFATDSISSFENIQTPIPIDTGTYETGKPLGGWEYKSFDGMFFARPGIYWPANLDNITEKEIKQIRARVIGRKSLLENVRRFYEMWNRQEMDMVLDSEERFWGMKSSTYATATEYKRNCRYGLWVPRPIKLSLNPLPKRTWTQEGNRLELRHFPHLTSSAYNKYVVSPEQEEIDNSKMMIEEQPC